MSFAADLNACARIVETGDPARFRTVMAAPRGAREKLFPLYAFNVEVSRAPWVTSEPLIAQMRLQWWQEALAEIGAGGIVRRHEVATPLAHVLSAQDIPDLDALVVARHWDCGTEAFDNTNALITYLTQTSGHLMQVAARMLGGHQTAAQAAGLGQGVANWLRAVPALRATGRVPLVDDSAGGIKDLARQGLQNLQTARQQLANSANPALPAFWPATGALRVLRIAARFPARVEQGQLPQTPGPFFALSAALKRW